MTATKPECVVVVVTDDCTRADLAETLALLNDNAKRIHRRGYIGVASEAYVLAHRRIDAVLDSWQDAKA
jgi:hypothetical protein